jgi:hypothetical protein
MKSLLLLPLVCMLGLGPWGAAPGPDSQPEAALPSQPADFAAFDIFVDSGEHPLAAYQVELRGEGKLAGIEGGDPAIYAEPPYYDPAALHESQLRERVVLAAFSTAADLPRGRVRIARIHVHNAGGGGLEVRLTAAGDDSGHRIEGRAEVKRVDARR